MWTSLSWSLSILAYWMCSRLRMSLNLFLTWDSVLPDIMFAISLHLLPSLNHCSRNCWSSLRVHWLFLMVGSIAVSHLSRHCLPFLAVICIWLKLPAVYYISTNESLSFSEILDQSLAPCLIMSCLRISSSCEFHLILLPPSFWMNNHLLWHFLASLVGTTSAIWAQSLSSKSSTDLEFLTMKAKRPYWKRWVSSSFHWVRVRSDYVGSFCSLSSLSKISIACSSEITPLP